MPRKHSRIQFLFLAGVGILIFGLGLGAGILFSRKDFSLDRGRITVTNKEPSSGDVSVDFELFWQAWDTLLQKYIHLNEIDPQKLLYGAISGMVKSVGDPYTAFFDPEEFESLKDQMAGKYEGVGIELGFKNGLIVVVSPFEGSPAAEKGVRAGDVILAVDGEKISSLSLSETATRIRGPKGTTVKISFLHEGEKEPFDVEITRAEITYKSVTVEFKNGIAHVRLVHFLETTNRDWDKVVREIEQEKPSGIVLDLRNNPGGYVNSAVYVAGDFVQNKVVTIEKFGDGQEKKLESEGLGRLADYPMVILINEGTASASEILAGALRHYEKGDLVGKKSFGKGIVQEEIPLSQGTALHVTNAEWLLPSGDNIHQKGLTPDVEIGVSKEEIEAGKDPQLEKALEILSQN